MNENDNYTCIVCQSHGVPNDWQVCDTCQTETQQDGERHLIGKLVELGDKYRAERHSGDMLNQTIARQSARLTKVREMLTEWAKESVAEDMEPITECDQFKNLAEFLALDLTTEHSVTFTVTYTATVTAPIGADIDDLSFSVDEFSIDCDDDGVEIADLDQTDFEWEAN